MTIIAAVLMALSLAGCVEKSPQPSAAPLTVDQMQTMPVSELSNSEIDRFFRETKDNSRYADARMAMIVKILDANRRVDNDVLVEAIKAFNKESQMENFVAASCQYFSNIEDSQAGGRLKLRAADQEFLRAIYDWSLSTMDGRAKKVELCSKRLLKKVDPGYVQQ
ncbi:hypothetical protein [Desulfatibacillum aliphaticivorans]|uniref:hypothetical protein n=1 Tax=Desulfatibacillum aliphaticivorans TaxID=218208 RepID=UPI0012F81579|nr:hypothetical protein [Desulfatibacillum aliphaticivorans]